MANRNKYSASFDENSYSENEALFRCGICMQVMGDPRTLYCGHTFCGWCIDRWNQRNATCPMCLEPTGGTPAVNITLRDVINKVLPGQARQPETIIPYYTRRISYDTPNPQMQNMSPEQRRRYEALGEKMLYGCGYTCLVVIMWIVITCLLGVYSWITSDTHALKPLPDWTPDDVGNWVNKLGPKFSKYANRFQTNMIDGNMLVSMHEEYLQVKYGMPVDDSNVFIHATKTLEKVDMQAPNNLWEYVTFFPGTVVFLICMRQYPQITFILLYYFQYQETLVPLIRASSYLWSDVQDINAQTDQYLDVTNGQWFSFVIQALFFPWLIYIHLIQMWYQVHPWISSLFFLYCALATTDVPFIWWNRFNLASRLHREFGFTRSLLRKALKIWIESMGFSNLLISLCTLGVLRLCLPIIPSVVCSITAWIYFYYGLTFVVPMYLLVNGILFLIIQVTRITCVFFQIDGGRFITGFLQGINEELQRWQQQQQRANLDNLWN